ncbi:MAG: RloB domain-containing protein, partial [Bacteroidota bacterium]
KRYLSKYEKNRKYYKEASPDLYMKLKPHLKNALTNAKSLGEFDPENPEAAKAEIYKLFEILGIEV